jgi:hypothetical protein
MPRETNWQVLGTPPKSVECAALIVANNTRIRLRGDDAVKAWVDGHVQSF